MTREDPGWRPALRAGWWAVVPILDLFARRHIERTSANQLIALRAQFFYAVLPLFLFLAILPFAASSSGSGKVDWFTFLVAGCGVLSLVNIRWLRRRPLMTNTTQTLAASYRAVLFIGVGSANSAALFGFVGVFIGGSFWLYLLGLAFALPGLALIAPTRADIERRQREIEAQGSSLSLLDALIDIPPPRWRWRRSP
jgi:hypothetical protein